MGFVLAKACNLIFLNQFNQWLFHVCEFTLSNILDDCLRFEGDWEEDHFPF